MAQLAELDSAPETIEATLDYFLDTDLKPVTLVAAPGGRDARTGGGKSDPHRVVIRNGRPYADRFRLEREGFRFVRHDTQVGDFYDEEEIRRVYYPEMEALVKAESGALRVVVFDHTLRTADDALRETAKIRDVVRRVHNDYTEWSGPQRVRDLLPDEAETLLRRRFAIVQVWRPIAIRSRASRWRSPTRRACRRPIWWSPSAATPTASGRPRRSPTTRRTAGTGSRACGPTKRWSSRPSNPRRTAAPASPRIRLLKTRRPRPMPDRAKASRSARSRFSEN